MLLNNNGNTLLMHAAMHSQLEFARLLIHQAKQRGFNGNTALMYATEQSCLSVMELLVPLEIRMKNDQGETAMSCFVQQNSMEVQCAKVLIEEAD